VRLDPLKVSALIQKYGQHANLTSALVDDHGVALAVSDDQRGRWVTIGGSKGADGKRHGGSPVFIVNGRITKGAPALAGRRIDALKEEADGGTHRQQLHREKEYSRARAAKEARAEGIDPADLHGLAAEMLAHDREHSQEREEVLRRAKDLFRHYGYGAESLTTNLRSGRVEDNPRALDLVADSLARSYPHQFAGHEDYGERLLDLFREGKPQRMSERDAYEAAREQLREQRRAYEAEDVPFSVGLATSPVLPKIPPMWQYHEDPDTRANNFEARSLGQRNRTDRPPAKPKYTLAEGRDLAAQLRAARQQQAAAPPPPKPDPSQQVQPPRLLVAQRAGALGTDGERPMAADEAQNNKALRSRVAKALVDLQSDTLFTVADEQTATDLDDKFPDLRGGMSWSDWLALVREAWKEIEPEDKRGVEMLGPSQTVEKLQGAGMSLEGTRRRPMSEGRADAIVEGQMNAGRRVPPSQPAAAFSMGLAQVGLTGMDPIRADQVFEEFARTTKLR
jgi:hypothetical protein